MIADCTISRVHAKNPIAKQQPVRIPVHAGHQFRSMPGHDSGPCRATVPVDAGRGV
jgi:hypothetical protein